MLALTPPVTAAPATALVGSGVCEGKAPRSNVLTQGNSTLEAAPLERRIREKAQRSAAIVERTVCDDNGVDAVLAG